MGRYFEDYETGQIIETPRRTIVDSDIWTFAGLTADFNPLHCDDIFAAEHHFGARVTHGPVLIGMAFGKDLATLLLARFVMGLGAGAAVPAIRRRSLAGVRIRPDWALNWPCVGPVHS